MEDKEQNSSLLAELARRRVFRAAGAYIVIAWVVVQVGSIVFPEFAAPVWAMRALIIALVVAFPPAMLAAWSIDVSSKGLVRTPDSRYSRARGHWPRLTMVIAASAMSAAVLWWLWDDYIVQPGQTRAAIKALPVVAVNAPRNIVGISDAAWLGDGIATMIRSSLAESSHAIVVSQARWNSLIADSADPANVLAIARRVGVDYIIDGNYVATPDGYVLTTRIDDVENGIVLHSSSSSEASVAELIASVPEQSIRIKQALRIPHQENVGLFEADFAIDNIEAYEAYIAGLAYLIDFDYQTAENAFKASLDVAPQFHIARFRLAQLYEATGQSTLARDTLNAIPEDADLSERLQLYIEGARYYFVDGRDTAKAIEVYARLVELYPYEMEAGFSLAEAYWLDFQDAVALNEFRRIAGIHSYDPYAWMALGERLLDAGELVEARDALERYVSMQPNDAFGFALLGNLAMMEGRFAASVEYHQSALDLKPDFVVAIIGLAQSQYLQEDVEAARSLWRSVVDNEDMAARFRIDAAFELAGILRGQGLFDASLAPLEDSMNLIEEEGLRLPMALSQLGSTYLELGIDERAQTLIDESVRIAVVPVTRYLFALGMLELHLGRFDRVEAVVDRIRSTGGEPDDPDRTEVKAANYLAGMSGLLRGEHDTAATYLEAAVAQTGYEYAVYKSGLAMLQRSTGNLERATVLARDASIERDRDDLRLDLELERARSQLLLAEILHERGLHDDAREQAQRFLDHWKSAAQDLPELRRARALLDDKQLAVR